MIDPVHSLAFSLQSNPGIYAVLVGSGVSRAAKIPTGWEITLDLVRKLAALHEGTCEPDPERWYRDTFQEQPDYSKILDALAKMPAERQQLLRKYWEPNDREREDGEKQPTAAHHAIAKLAAQDFIRVIVTTNFDRLLEKALAEQDITPTVLSSPDQVRGTLPLIHTRCCVLKLHGDYLDTRIRNTMPELDEYPKEFDDILDRIFDEFGLIICGWSAEWDGALRRAMERAPSRRFTTYWATRSEPSNQARRLIDLRAAQVIRIEDADTFFTTVQQHVQSIEEFSKPHPVSVEAAVATLKRYVSDPRCRIKLSDLIDELVRSAIESTSGVNFSGNDPRPTTESVTACVRRYEAACSALLASATVGGYWVEDEHYGMWRRALQRLASMKNEQSVHHEVWRTLTLYPSTLLLYVLGLGAIENGRLRFLGHVLKTPMREEHLEEESAVQKLPPFCLFFAPGTMQLLNGMERRHAPLNDWIFEALWPHAERVIADKRQYEITFDKLEVLIALGYLYHAEKQKRRELVGPWAPPGAFAYRHSNRIRILEDIEESLSRRRDESSYVACGIFGETVGECRRSMELMGEFVSTTLLRW